jgi:hypothetical protein
MEKTAITPSRFRQNFISLPSLECLKGIEGEFGAGGNQKP